MSETCLHTERRRFERFRLTPGYTGVQLRVHGGQGEWALGHACDISEGGVRLDVDDAFAPGTAVDVKVELPRCGSTMPCSESCMDDVCATGSVVWCDTEDQAGARIAIEFKAFDAKGDRERLVHRLSAGRFLRAA